MSTRSGKRIHSSFHENILKTDIEHVSQSERKTRSKRHKENIEEISVSVMKPKKRSNYVSYPVTDDEAVTGVMDNKGEDTKQTRSLRRNALREQSNATTECTDLATEVFKSVRKTRRTQKFIEDTEDAQDNSNHVEEVAIGKQKSKKKKKSIETGDVTKKKPKKKVKKAKRSGSMVIEDVPPKNGQENILNKSNMSSDSFYSAAGSPVTHLIDTTTPIKGSKIDSKSNSTDTSNSIVRQTRSVARRSLVINPEITLDKTAKASRKRKSSFKDVDTTANNEFDVTLTNVTKKRKSIPRDTVSERYADETLNRETNNSTFELKGIEQRKSATNAVRNASVNNSDTIDTTLTNNKNTSYEKEQLIIETQIPESSPRSAYEKSNETEPVHGIIEIPAIDTTFEKKDLDSITRQSAIINTTYEKDCDDTKNKPKDPESILNSTYEKCNEKVPLELLSIDVKKPAINTTFDKEDLDSYTRKSAIINTTYEKDSDDTKNKTKRTQSSIINDTYDKDDISSDIISEDNDSNTNLRKSSVKQSTPMNSTYDKAEKSDITLQKGKKSDSTFDKDDNSSSISEENKKLDTTFEKKSKLSLISSDNSNITLDKSDISRISITSDESKENIVNTTPVLIESSLDESQINRLSLQTDKELKSPETTKIQTPPVTPLKREGTFTKDGSDVTDNNDILKTPTRTMSLPSPGCTPFPNKSGSRVMNLTHSLEKSRRSSLAEPLPRATKVMFCSPVNNPVVVSQQRRKIIKSNLKGSNKSFVFEEDGLERRAAPRKRSYTHNDAEEARAKRNRAEGAQPPGRPARTRTTSATDKPGEGGTPKKAVTPRISRTRLPNFAALHQRQFAMMESLDECQERKARRAKHLLTPTGAVTVLDRTSPKEPTETDSTATKSEDTKKSPLQEEDSNRSEKQPKEAKKPITPIKSLPTLKSLNPGYTRFGFKLNCDVNPFTINKNDKNNSLSVKKTVKKDLTRPLKEIKGLKRQATLPSLAGATSVREAAKQTIMREKSFTDKRNKSRNENRTIIKGVRTNRRFELQMKMRNLE